MKSVASNLANLKPNLEWASLPLFDRTGWKRVRFGDVVENCAETCDPAEAGLDRFIAMEHLEPGSLHVRSWGNVADGTTFTRRCRPGQVLFGKRRAYQRKVAVAEFEAVVSGDIYVLAPKDTRRLLPELLPFLCLSERFFQHAVGTSAGSLSPRTNWSSLASFEFDLPPLDQQCRIAEILWAVDEVRQAFEKSTQAAATVCRAKMQCTFSNGEYPTVTIRESGDVQLGRQRAPKYQSGKFTKPYLRVANVFDGFIDYGDILEMDFDERDLQTYILRPGDILLNEGQSRELVGRCAIYDGKLQECCFQNTLIRYRAGDKVLTEYAFAFFQHSFHTGVFAAISSQTTSIAHLGADRFGKLRIPIPPKREQRKIASDYAEIKNAEHANAEYVSHIKRLHSSLINSVTA
jgi:type I restriction enzyme S subunit